MGRSLLNALNNLDVLDQYKEALTELGYKLETLVGGMGGNADNTSRASECWQQGSTQPCSCTLQALRGGAIALRLPACRWRRSVMQRWATAALVAWPPASWTPWPRSTCRRGEHPACATVMINQSHCT